MYCMEVSHNGVVNNNTIKSYLWIDPPPVVGERNMRGVRWRKTKYARVRRGRLYPGIGRGRGSVDRGRRGGAGCRPPRRCRCRTAPRRIATPPPDDPRLSSNRDRIGRTFVRIPSGPSSRTRRSRPAERGNRTPAKGRVPRAPGTAKRKIVANGNLPSPTPDRFPPRLRGRLGARAPPGG